ncbi:MAG: hypothetical protein WC389_21395 [Lutibacter sp.]|jgi:hypothetical protein
MGTNRNIGVKNSFTVYGDPVSFQKLIQDHGQLCKIKQAMFCPCDAENGGSPKIHCPICNGFGYVYTYQRRFLIADESSLHNDTVTELYPFYIPILEVTKVERIIAPVQGGIVELPVLSFDAETIFVDNSTVKAKKYELLRATYFFDGWTKVEGDTLIVDETNGLLWPTQTYYNAEYQSSNPLRAESDIVEITRLYNFVTGKEITNYERVGNTIQSKDVNVVSGQVKADYYYADLTQIITADLKTKDDLEVWTNDLESGIIRMAVYPWFNIAKGDIIVIAADTQSKTEMLPHRGELDMLWQIEIFELNDVILDSDGKIYYREEDYILVGNRYIKWLTTNQPKIGKTMSVKYGYKPTFVCFEDNPEPNNLENRRYPKIIYAKSWTKTNKEDLVKLMSDKK